MFLENSASNLLICSGVKAVLGRFFGTSDSTDLRGSGRGSGTIGAVSTGEGVGSGVEAFGMAKK